MLTETVQKEDVAEKMEELESAKPVEVQERVKLIMTVQVQENAAKISSVSRARAYRVRVMTKLAEATVVAMEEIVKLLLNAKADSVACT